jgi:hypothetical protein
MAIAAADPPMIDWAISINLARSKRSARAPLVSENASRGRVEEATIKPTQVLEPVSSSMSHDAATDCTKVPDAENTFPAHSQRKWGYLRGSTADDIGSA